MRYLAPWQFHIIVFFTACAMAFFPSIATTRGDTLTSPPLSAEQSLQTMQLPPDLQIELVAAEPMVRDPVAICWDATGAMYVAEMGDYPALPTGGRIRRLMDTNQDGRADQGSLFAEGIPYPTSVLPYRDGILVAAAPDIWWLRDLDHDGVADERTRVLTGFGEGNQQLRVNGLMYGLDNWIYGANGRSDGDIGFVDSQGKMVAEPLSLRSRDFRFHMDLRRVEPAGGFTQFGQACDDFGQRFISWNTIHIRHVAMEQRYLTQNRHAPLTATTQEISDGGSTPRLYPISTTTPRFNAEIPGFFNASCGLTIYRGNALGPAYQGNAFACEPLSNIVHRDLLQKSGATFTATRPETEQDREFLASTDPWFRPVNLATGPDGSLYVVDFYRKWVEHPQWVANEQDRHQVDWAEGAEYGRVYRITARDHDLNDDTSPSFPTDLSQLDANALVRLLSHANAWQRETAQRLLVERRAVEVTAAITDLAVSGTTDTSRVHALGTLDGLNQLTPAVLLQAIDNGSPSVQRVAIQFSESQLAKHCDLATVVAGLASSPDSHVRYQVACTLSYAPTSPELLSALAHLFHRDGEDPWMRQALFAACGGRVAPFLEELLRTQVSLADLRVEQLRWLLQIIGSEGISAPQHWQSPPLSESNAHNLAAYQGILALGLNSKHYADTFENLADVIQNEQHPLNHRLVAIGQLRFVEPSLSLPLLQSLLTPSQSLEIQQWACETAFAIDHPDAAKMLLRAFRTMSPAIQRIVTDHLVSRRELAPQFATALEAGDLLPSDLDGPQRHLLLSRLDEPLLARVQTLLVPPSREPKDQLIHRYAEALSDPHDVARGRLLFDKHCQTCHLRHSVGNRVGPDLTAVAARSRTDILADILDPDRSVSVDGRGFTLLRHDGAISSGVIVGETETTVSLKKAGGILEAVLRKDIEELRFTGKSLMPEGFEQVLTPDDLNHLIAFLKAPEPSQPKATELPWRVGFGTSEMSAEDAMVIGGGIGPGLVQGQEGKLQATAVVIHGETSLCLVSVDILMMNRDYLDQAARGIEQACEIPFDNILINASHTHHAPSTVTIHGYERDEEFCRRTVAAIIDAAKQANLDAKRSLPASGRFRLGQEATVGQNSRQLLQDGKIYWIGPRDEFVRPTGPFDVDLPVIAFQRSDESYAGLLFNHSTHCIGTRSGKRSPGFYGLAAQELAEELHAPVGFLSGAAGSTHNLNLDCDEMVVRIKGAVREALVKSAPMSSSRLAAIRREIPFHMRKFDEATEDEAVSTYCHKYAPGHAEAIIDVFRKSRESLRRRQGETDRMWLQAMQIGDVYLVGVPAEFFTIHGLEIKRRSPYRNTFVCGLSNDYVGYLPDRAGFQQGGYQTWMGLHSFTEIGTGEMVVDECLKLLAELQEL